MKAIKRSLVAFFLLLVITARADEGMWLPLFLQQLNEKQMKSMGMKISASDIYNINKGSLKDAIVSLGGFCTGEVISEQGLILTNHHCGFDAIQNHSTLERNYIRDGFWARNKGEEIPNPGLFVTFIVRIEEVTKSALAGVTQGMTEQERQSAIDKNIAALRSGVKREAYQDYFVRSFFEGNQYFLFVTETYKDVRLVGARRPLSGISERIRITGCGPVIPVISLCSVYMPVPIISPLNFQRIMCLISLKRPFLFPWTA